MVYVCVCWRTRVTVAGVCVCWRRGGDWQGQGLCVCVSLMVCVCGEGGRLLQGPFLCVCVGGDALAEFTPFLCLKPYHRVVGYGPTGGQFQPDQWLRELREVSHLAPPPCAGSLWGPAWHASACLLSLPGSPSHHPLPYPQSVSLPAPSQA